MTVRALLNFLFNLRAYHPNSAMARIQAFAWAVIVGGAVLLLGAFQ